VNDQFRTDSHGVTPADRKLRELQRWINGSSPVKVNVIGPGKRLVHHIDVSHLQKYSGRAVEVVQTLVITVFESLFNLVLVIVISVYMLLDMDRLSRSVDRRFPPPPGRPPLLVAIEQSLASYVKGQVLLSAIMGVSAGFGLWLLGTIGLAPGMTTYAVLFGAWVAFTELIPYLGPWLGAIPPLVYELVVHPISALWVALLFVFIHQIEGHVVVPNVMGSALRLHPLLVIFGLLAGGEIYGLPGVFVALPLLAAARATWEFFADRITLEPWDASHEPVPVPVEVERPDASDEPPRIQAAP
jgi:predicted PurR-regulated permease PerM